MREALDPERYPNDWPAAGPIDLSVHDLPHASATLEWWYVNGHCRMQDGREFSYFAAFFRKVQGYHPVTGTPRYAHSVTWAISNFTEQHSQFVSRVDPNAPREGLRRLQTGLGPRDPRLNRALTDILERGTVPKPDVMFDRRICVELTQLDLDYAGDTFRKQADGSYHLRLHDAQRGLGCDLTLTPQKLPVRHGDAGVVRGPEDEAMFYYFIPRCNVLGTLTWAGRTSDLTQGQGWYDHEFGVGAVEDPDPETEALLDVAAREQVQRERRARWDARQIGWNWISAQLDDGSELTHYPEYFLCSGESAGEYTLTVSPQGEAQRWTNTSLQPLAFWQSTQTFVEYPVRFRLQIPDAGLDLEVASALHDQEVMTLIAGNSFYEGRVNITGTRHGQPVTGIGFMERSGLGVPDDLDGFFNGVSKLVRSCVQTLMPEQPSFEQATFLLTAADKAHYMQGVDIEQYARAHLHPIREMVDRGGKGWRSYAMNTCIDVVGGDSRQFVDFLAVPELMQTGSLMVDDVEDRSAVRRGGPAAHILYGEAQAINSGTAAYFIGAPVLRTAKLADRQLVQIYEVYFDALRAAHAGQALDLDGFMPLMQRAVHDSEAASLLITRVLAVHRLKTGAPAGCLARIGAIMGGGTSEQTQGLGLYFEDIGLAFQIVDDVLNLRGFKDNWKEMGEDISQGKITLPIAQAMTLLAPDQRHFLYTTLQARPDHPEVIARVVEVVDRCGAITACEQLAQKLIEEGWSRVASSLEDSIAKMMLRAFGWYVLDRHY